MLIFAGVEGRSSPNACREAARSKHASAAGTIAPRKYSFGHEAVFPCHSRTVREITGVDGFQDDVVEGENFVIMQSRQGDLHMYVYMRPYKVVIPTLPPNFRG